MGTGTSRGKKVAPARVSDVNAPNPAAGAASPKRDSALFKPLNIQTVLRSARPRSAQPDRHSEGPDSDCSGDGDEDEVEADLDTVLADYGEPERVSAKKSSPRKTFMRSRTYGLCHFGRADTEEDPGGPEEPRVSPSGRRDVNKKSKAAFTEPERNTAACPTQHNSFRTRAPLFGAVPENQTTLGSCPHSPLAMPVLLYHGSEEELMDTIEREFS